MSFLCINEPINRALITAARSAPHQVALIKPSKTQLKVLRSIGINESVTASQVATRLGLSESWASTLLKELARKLFLDRQGCSRQLGGVEFVYRLREDD